MDQQSNSHSTHDRTGEAQPRATPRSTSRMDSAAVKPVRDPLAALEAARRLAHDEEMEERWDGLS